ncbi:hypothetical protein Bca4012_002520 [Brassica carinata]
MVEIQKKELVTTGAIPLQVNRPAAGQITDFALVQQMCDTKHVLSDSDKSAITISTFD